MPLEINSSFCPVIVSLKYLQLCTELVEIIAVIKCFNPVWCLEITEVLLLQQNCSDCFQIFHQKVNYCKKSTRAENSLLSLGSMNLPLYAYANKIAYKYRPPSLREKVIIPAVCQNLRVLKHVKVIH